MWRSTVVVRQHQRQLLFMQLQRYADRQAARVMRSGAAFLSGTTLSATAAANATKRGERFHGSALLLGKVALLILSCCLTILTQPGMIYNMNYWGVEKGCIKGPLGLCCCLCHTLLRIVQKQHPGHAARAPRFCKLIVSESCWALLLPEWRWCSPYSHDNTLPCSHTCRAMHSTSSSSSSKC